MTEYQACNDTRNHYDNICWVIGSIFIATAFLIFGASFTAEVMPSLKYNLLLAFTSITVLSIWYVFAQHIYPFVWLAVVRCHQIEQNLRTLGYNVKLQKSIFDYKQKLKGNYIVFGILVLIDVAWLARIILLPDFLTTSNYWIIPSCLRSLSGNSLNFPL